MKNVKFSLGFLLFSAGFLFLAGSGAGAQEGSRIPSGFDALVNRARELNQEYMTRTVERVAVRLKLAEAYRGMGDSEAEAEQLTKAVRMNCRRAEAQVRLAELEMDRGELFRARERLLFVTDFLQTEETVAERAEKLLGDPRLEEAADLPRHANLPEGRVYLTMVGKLPQVFWDTLASRLTQEFRVPVVMKRTEHQYTSENVRRRLEPYFDFVIQNLEDKIGEKGVRRLYRELGIPEEGPESFHEKGRVVQTALEQMEHGEKMWEVALWANQDQYPAADLLRQLREVTSDWREDPNALAVIGVTSSDLFLNKENNFIYGFGQKESYLMSINRFYNPTDRLHVGLRGSVIQAYSALAQILDVPLAEEPPAATAPFDELKELKGREDRLSPEVVGALAERYAQLKE